MQETPLTEYLKKTSQAALADLVGCHQTTISQMVRHDRPMFVIENDDGTVELIEKKFKKLI